MKKGELGIVEKAKDDLQTEADRSAQRCIIASLQQQFPKVAIFGEEELDNNESVQPDWIETTLDSAVMKHSLPDMLKDARDEEVVVWVDPLDGTSEYTQGLLDHVTVLIGIAVNGKSVAGVIYQPFYNYQAGPEATRGRCIWGVIGLGGFGYESEPLPDGKNIIVTTRSHGTGTVAEAVDACEPTEVNRVGGAGHKVLLLIEGKAKAYVFASPGCKKWDTCAPEAVLHAAGGRLTDIHGQLYQYHPSVQRRNVGGVLATARAEDHQWYADKIPENVKASLPTDVL
ncbi:3'(2'),5'-bisphosphate nucleotidase 1 [Lamellibrachia satsuma]|nr:3'(2'),5'-bisphosphate nucleotidase 1 [Lamellibrachia satsuma]